MARFHVSPEGPGKCGATKGKCPYGGESGDENHFDSLGEAEAHFAEKMKHVARPNLEKRAKYPLTPEEKALRRKNYDAAAELVKERAEAGEIIYDDANLERAERRLRESIEYAKGRENTHLVDKLSNATVLPSGAFRTGDGRRVNTDAVLKSYVATKAIEEAREKALTSLASRIGDTEVGTKFSYKDASGSYSLTVAEAMDDRAYDALPEEVRLAISSEKEGFDSELARNALTKEEYEAISNPTQVIDYVVGKAPAHDVPALSLRESKSDGSKADLQDGLQDIAGFYAGVHKSVGKVRELKASLSEGSDAIKATAAKRPGNTFAPARSQYNGAVVSGRRTIDPKKAAELLSPEKLAAIKKVTLVPDREKAKAVLSAEDFGKIFEARKLSLRVTEAKG